MAAFSDTKILIICLNCNLILYYFMKDYQLFCIFTRTEILSPYKIKLPLIPFRTSKVSQKKNETLRARTGLLIYTK